MKTVLKCCSLNETYLNSVGAQRRSCSDSGLFLLLYVKFSHAVEEKKNIFKYNGDLLEGAAQTGVETFGGPQPFILYADTCT